MASGGVGGVRCEQREWDSRAVWRFERRQGVGGSPRVGVRDGIQGSG